MVGLVVASHGRLADELVATAEQIVGKLPAVATCNIEPGTSVEELRAKMRRAVEGVDQGEGVIVMADLFGGSPCKESLMMCSEGGCQSGKLEVLAGINLPMLLKANSLRSEELPLPEMAAQLASYGQRNITCASALLREAQQRQQAAVPRT
ncbi:PTS sugar transporter subunit IIA [Archangium sp.]|uniref:PTS sugar transporter subunit IIA n=1 Tax=Archangium sp. TaxID=1872627 RepID=UPI002EDB07ED